MQYTHLGRSGLSVSRLVLGTMNFGMETRRRTASPSWTPRTTAGLNFFDTANRYGGKTGPGGTEKILGRWFAQGGGRREKTVLATKLYGEMGDWPNDGELSALNIRRALDASLQRLQTDYVDLYQFHHIDRDTPWDEIWQAMDVAVAAGQGPLRRQQQLRRLAHRHGAGGGAKAGLHGAGVRAVALQPLDRTVELEVVPAAQHYGLGIIPWSPLQGGLLGGVLKKGATSRRTTDGRRRHSRRTADQIEHYEDFAEELGQKPGDVALAWLLHQPAVTAPIIGPRTMEQLDLRAARARRAARRGRAGEARRDLPGPQARPGGLRLVSNSPPR